MTAIQIFRVRTNVRNRIHPKLRHYTSSGHRIQAHACTIARNAEKMKRIAISLDRACKGARVIGIGAVDFSDLKNSERAVERCVNELGTINYVMSQPDTSSFYPGHALNAFKTVLEIDTRGCYNILNGRIIFISATVHYIGLLWQAHAAVAKIGIDAAI
ncbi:hypothetical protein OIDMADRAFT_117384 [Oidiodendron maius Zn]|uniref:Uncharacterized protein n=1 Tax=Oidiodendron maius (strain Zn) TaxID=913774 RepID=A0A0C3HK83_OIDMZ|nr:hypothetical protein OIDMADRAFT_117384 [Oidiodendron maius Zn]